MGGGSGADGHCGTGRADSSRGQASRGWRTGRSHRLAPFKLFVAAAAAADDDDDDVETTLRPRDPRGERGPCVHNAPVRRRFRASRTANARPTCTARGRDVHNGYRKRGAVGSTFLKKSGSGGGATTAGGGTPPLFLASTRDATRRGGVATPCTSGRRQADGRGGRATGGRGCGWASGGNTGRPTQAQAVAAPQARRRADSVRPSPLTPTAPNKSHARCRGPAPFPRKLRRRGAGSAHHRWEDVPQHRDRGAREGGKSRQHGGKGKQNNPTRVAGAAHHHLQTQSTCVPRGMGVAGGGRKKASSTRMMPEPHA